MTSERAEFSSAEKREERLKRWISPPGASFASRESLKACRQRTTQLALAFQFKQPGKMPVFWPAQFSAPAYIGTDLLNGMFHHAEMLRARLKSLNAFETDTCPKRAAKKYSNFN
jgi:hypothetical protein